MVDFTLILAGGYTNPEIGQTLHTWGKFLQHFPDDPLLRSERIMLNYSYPSIV